MYTVRWHRYFQLFKNSLFLHFFHCTELCYKLSRFGAMSSVDAQFSVHSYFFSLFLMYYSLFLCCCNVIKYLSLSLFFTFLNRDTW